MIKKLLKGTLSYIGTSSNFSNSSMHRNSFKDLSRPSLPKKLQEKIPGIVSLFNKKQSELNNKYVWLNSPTTSKSYANGTLKFSNTNYSSVIFNTCNVARYDKNSKIWSWSWVDKDNMHLESDSSNIFRAYGGSKKIELMYKANWNASEQEVENIVALCAIIKNAIGVDVEEIGGVQCFRLLLEDTLNRI